MKPILINIKLLIVFFAVSLNSCSSHKTNRIIGYCCVNCTKNSCYTITLKQLIDSGEKFESKYIEVEGFLSLSFEDVAIYESNKDRSNLQSKAAYWLNFNDSLLACIDSKTAILHTQKVIVRGVVNSKRKGHLSAYSGEIDNVFYVQIVK